MQIRLEPLAEVPLESRAYSYDFWHSVSLFSQTDVRSYDVRRPISVAAIFAI